jgi:predicted NUDIX family NTP pyrophosphohydrolase
MERGCLSPNVRGNHLRSGLLLSCLYFQVMATTSAGLLMYRIRDGHLQVLLAHPGGPFWKNKDKGAWTIPKGEVDENEDLLMAALREFEEETGIVPSGPFLPLGYVKNKSGKIVHAWAFAGDCDPTEIRSNLFSIEWPPNSGRQREFPEIDKALFYDLSEARLKIATPQITFLDVLASLNPSATISARPEGEPGSHHARKR